MMENRIAVLLAAYNGTRWIDEQLESILQQRNVIVDVYVSVDTSSDGTYEHCLQLAELHKNIIVLPYGEKYGGAARNFYRLVRDVDFSDYQYVSFADQDDIWDLDKLAKAVTVMTDKGYDCYSSNVLAFWSDGREALIEKAQKQVDYDYCFESAGPGCTYVFSQKVAVEFQSFVAVNHSEVDKIELHDWMIYAFSRQNAYKWFIDPWPSMQYRQHDNNQFGANGGFAAAIRRIKMIRNGWYLSEVKKIVGILGLSNEPFFVNSLKKGYSGNVFMVFNINKVRRKLRDRISLATLLILGMLK